MRKYERMKEFKKNVKLCKKRGWDMDELKRLMGQIIAGNPPLPRSADEHPLISNWAGRIECKLKGDQLLVYRIVDEDGNNIPFAEIYQDLDKQTVIFEAMGTHSDL